MLDTAASIQAEANAQAADLIRRQQVKVRPKKVSTEKVRDTTVPTFKEKLTQQADRIDAERDMLHGHRDKITTAMTEAVDARHFDVNIIKVVSGPFVTGHCGCGPMTSYDVILYGSDDLRLACEQFDRWFRALGFDTVRKTQHDTECTQIIRLGVDW